MPHNTNPSKQERTCCGKRSVTQFAAYCSDTRPLVLLRRETTIGKGSAQPLLPSHQLPTRASPSSSMILTTYRCVRLLRNHGNSHNPQMYCNPCETRSLWWALASVRTDAMSWAGTHVNRRAEHHAKTHVTSLRHDFRLVLMRVPSDVTRS